MARFATAFSSAKASKGPRVAAPTPKPALRSRDRYAEGAFSLVAATAAQAPVIQAKLEIGEPDDQFEKEADLVADHVMRMTDGAAAPPEPPDPGRTATPVLQRTCAKCEHDEATLQRDAVARTPAIAGRASAGFAQNLSLARASGGHALPSGVRSFMEPRFGNDFAHVRVHRDTRADQLTRSVHARAFTVGHDLFFRQGEFQPSSSGGRRLIAHELTHTLQQRPHAPRGRVIQRQTAEAPNQAPPARRDEPPAELEMGQVCEVAHAEAGVVVGARTRKSLKPGSQVEVVAPRYRGDPKWVPIRVLDAAPGSGAAAGTMAPIQRVFLGECTTKGSGNAAIAPAASAPQPDLGIGQIIAQGPVTFVVDAVPAGAGPGISAAGLSLHVLASGDLSWLAGPAAARRVLSADYWSPLVVRRSTVVLDRLVNELPRDLAPKIAAELAAQAEAGAQRLSWLGEGFTEAELRSLPELVARVSANEQLGAAELLLLRRAAGLHIGGSSPGAPFASYMNPDHVLTNVGTREFRVRVELPKSSALDVSKPNAFNEGLEALTNVEEGEWLVTSSERGRIVSVQRGGTSQAGFLLRNAEAIRWGGRALFVVGLGVSAYRIASAAPEERVKVVGEEAGGQLGGFAGASAAVAGCLLLGIATGGVGLFVCGLAGGIGGGLMGSAIGGAMASDLQRGAPPCPSCHAIQRAQAERAQRIDFAALDAIGRRRDGLTADDVSTLKNWLARSGQANNGAGPASFNQGDLQVVRQWLQSLPPRKR